MPRKQGPQEKELAEPFPAQLLESLNKGGARLTYVPVGEVVTRLNDVLGPGGWTWTVVKVWRDPVDPEWVLAVGVMEATVDGVTSRKGGCGGVKVKRTSSTKDIVDLGDEFKGADSDALKKATQRFGVGLWLARSAEARAYERPESAWDPVEAGWTTNEEYKENIADLRSLIQNLDAEEHARWVAAREQWAWPPDPDTYRLMEETVERLLAGGSQEAPGELPAEAAPATPPAKKAAAKQAAPAKEAAKQAQQPVSAPTSDALTPEQVLQHASRLRGPAARSWGAFLRRTSVPPPKDMSPEQLQAAFKFIDELLHPGM